MRNIPHSLWYFIPFVLLTGILAGFLLSRRDRPPLEAFESARLAIHEARKGEAGIYSPEYFRKSEDLFDSAMVHWQKQNEAFFLRRDYTTAGDFAGQSARYALLAKEYANELKGSLPGMLKERIESLGSQLKANRALLSVLPFPDPEMKNLSRGRLNLAEAESAYKRGNYLLCREKLEAAEVCLGDSFRSADRMLKTYFENYQDWQRQANNTIQYSARTQSEVIIVDKIAREARFYQKGKQERAFRIELGTNWIGDKHFQGDKATPEGYYSVVEKKMQPNTSYHKALLLNYPNLEDVKRFNLNRRNGVIPASAEIGGHIEIHGEGGKGNDWTDGCIALKNPDMDVLYGLARPGTRVTIVGSLQPLDSLWETSFR